ncbi:MAG: hypothetical protein NWS71_02055 [Opitutales bacterium]|nr:hypothetical protein [Opitutales bacterium]
MRLNFLTLFCPLVVLCLLASASRLHAQAPLVTDQVVAPEAGEAIALEWRLAAAERAFRSGLVGLAESGYRAILVNPTLELGLADDVRVSLAAALIAQQRYIAARTELAAVREAAQSSRYNLYLAVALYGDGKGVDSTAFDEAVAKVKPAQLSAMDRAWLFLLRGLQAEMAGKPQAVVPAFEKAVAAAQSESLKAFFSSLVFLQKIKDTPADPGLASDIRNQLERLSREAAAYPYARQYAVMLYNLERAEEAIAVIDDQRVNNTNLGSREREQLLLLKGMIAGRDSLRGREALQDLLRIGKTRDVLRVALQLLASGPDATSGSLSEFLNQMIARTEPHPLLGDIYFIRSQLALARAEIALNNNNLEMARQETAIAEADARYLLEQFPGLQQITSVYRLLAYAALQRTPPQYRAAADFLIQLRDQTEVLADRVVLNRLIGDCYFLNADYNNAVDFYLAAHTKAIDGGRDGELFLRLITAEVRSDQMDAALQHIDQADFTGGVSVSDRWRAEWNIAQALKAEGQLDVALTRVRLLLEGGAANVPTTLDVRLRWMEAYLSFLAKDEEGLLERVSALLARVESLPVEKLDSAESKLLITEILLLQAQILIGSGQANDGMVVLERLRVGYANSAAAQRSYLTEADYHGSIADLKSAQETLSKLASIYPQSVLAPQAIFEAGIYCERRGAEFYEEAVRLHYGIEESYPSDTLVFSAGLKQGDLLRKLNKFTAAQKIYENLINTYPTHPLRYVSELSRVDCMLALAKNNVSQLNDVAISLERLIDIPNLPIDFQAEVGYKWGFALLKRDAPEEAKEVFLLISSRFFLDGDQAVQLGGTGRYWMSRALLALGNILEESGELAEAKRVYRKMVAFNLPGRNLALDRANSIQVVE